MLNSIFYRSRDEIAIVFQNKIYTVSEIYSMAEDIVSQLSQFEPFTHPRFLIPVHNPVFFMACLIACWSQCYVLIPKRQDLDDVSMSTYKSYLPNASIELQANGDYKL